jgi:hypothetical protein
MLVNRSPVSQYSNTTPCATRGQAVPLLWSGLCQRVVREVLKISAMSGGGCSDDVAGHGDFPDKAVNG